MRLWGLQKVQAKAHGVSCADETVTSGFGDP